jgi:hypothetical protein
MAVEFASTLCLANEDPVGGAIARSPETLSVDEGLQEDRCIFVTVLPIREHALDGSAQDAGGEVGRDNPGKDQETGVVDHEGEIAPTLLRGPADKLVAWRHGPSRGAKPQGGEEMMAAEDQISELSSRQGLVSEVMVALNEFVPEDGVLTGIHKLELERTELFSRNGQGTAGVAGRGEFGTEAAIAVAFLGRG